MPVRIEVIEEYIRLDYHASDGTCYSAAQFITRNELHNYYFEPGDPYKLIMRICNFILVTIFNLKIP